MRKLRRAAVLACCAAMVLTGGCGVLPWNRSPYERMYANDPSPSPTVTAALELTSPVTDNRFTLKYDADETLNPIECTATYNLAVTELMYEGLFTVTEDFRAENVLCEDMTTEDGVEWVITVKQGIFMHDGSILTAHDVAYSINEARNSEKYSERLSVINEFSVTGDYTIYMALDNPDYKAALLLDVPVIRDGSMYEAVPAGSGPYTYTADAPAVTVTPSPEPTPSPEEEDWDEEDGDEDEEENEEEKEKTTGVTSGKLTAFSLHRDYASLPVNTIYLADTDYDQLTLAFTNSTIDLLQYDPTGLSMFNIRVDTEYHYYDTTVLQYLGFNEESVVCSDYRFRQAIYYAVDRSGIVSGAMNGAAVASPLILSPRMSGYDKSWEPDEAYSMTEMCSILAQIGLNDNNADGFLEYPVNGAMTAFTLKFIVNSENSYKVAAAEMIAQSLESVGIHVDLQELAWEDFENAVLWGEYDMYYGETRLGADFNLRSLTSAYGALNYGGQLGVSDAALAKVAGKDTDQLDDLEYLQSLNVEFYSDVIQSYLGATDADRPAAAEKMCQYFLEDCYVVPILYKQYAVVVHRGVITGLEPSTSGVFRNFSDWQIHLG